MPTPALESNAHNVLKNLTFVCLIKFHCPGILGYPQSPA